MNYPKINNKIKDSFKKVKMPKEFNNITLGGMLKLKEELGSKVYNEAIFGSEKHRKTLKNSDEVVRKHQKLPAEEDSNGPKEMFAKRQVPFLGHYEKKSYDHKKPIDPRFNAKSGQFENIKFKENYLFLKDIREREIVELRKEFKKTENEDERTLIKKEIIRLTNKNLEDQRWRNKQKRLKEVQLEMQRSLEQHHSKHYPTKKESRARELVEQFEELQKYGGLSKHLEKRRKKNAAKDRKKISLD